MKEVLDKNINVEGHTKKPLLKAIREKCLDCCVNQPAEVRICHITDCSLWPYRMGTNPFRNRTMTNDEKRLATKRLRKSSKEQT